MCNELHFDVLVAKKYHSDTVAQVGEKNVASNKFFHSFTLFTDINSMSKSDHKNYFREDACLKQVIFDF